MDLPFSQEMDGQRMPRNCLTISATSIRPSKTGISGGRWLQAGGGAGAGFTEGRKHFTDAFIIISDGDVERTAAVLTLVIVPLVSVGRRRGLRAASTGSGTATAVAAFSAFLPVVSTWTSREPSR